MKTRIVAKCTDCGWICRGFLFDRDDGPTIVPIGVADCQECDGDEFDRVTADELYDDCDRDRD